MFIFFDPRFKARFFSSVNQQAEARKLLLQEVEKLKARLDTETTDEPPANRRTTELWQCFNEILEESGASAEGLSSDANAVDQYLSEPLLEFYSNCLIRWSSGSCDYRHTF